MKMDPASVLHTGRAIIALGALFVLIGGIIIWWSTTQLAKPEYQAAKKLDVDKAHFIQAFRTGEYEKITNLPRTQLTYDWNDTELRELAELVLKRAPLDDREIGVFRLIAIKNHVIVSSDSRFDIISGMHLGDSIVQGMQSHQYGEVIQAYFKRYLDTHDKITGATLMNILDAVPERYIETWDFDPVEKITQNLNSYDEFIFLAQKHGASDRQFNKATAYALNANIIDAAYLHDGKVASDIRLEDIHIEIHDNFVGGNTEALESAISKYSGMKFQWTSRFNKAEHDLERGIIKISVGPTKYKSSLGDGFGNIWIFPEETSTEAFSEFKEGDLISAEGILTDTGELINCFRIGA